MTGSIPTDLNIYHVKDDNRVFVCDALNKGTNETAKRWCSSWGKGGISKIDNVPNVPRTGYYIQDLEIRSEGGRAYKVFTPDADLVDLREDTMLDILKNEGIVFGEIKSSLLWATVGSQMKLIRSGGDTEKVLRQYMYKKTAKNIPKEDLQVGGIYSSQGNEQFIYLGQVDGIKVKNERGYITDRYVTTKLTNVQLWYQDSPWRAIKTDSEQSFYDSFHYYGISFVKSKVVKLKVGQLDFNIDLTKLSDVIKNQTSNDEYYRQYWDFKQAKLFKNGLDTKA